MSTSNELPHTKAALAGPPRSAAPRPDEPRPDEPRPDEPRPDEPRPDEPPTVDPARPSTTWERHHCEIVAEAPRDVGRASGILREHLADVLCDPLAVHIVCAALRAGARRDDRIADLADVLASTAECHPPAASTSPT